MNPAIMTLSLIELGSETIFERKNSSLNLFFDAYVRSTHLSIIQIGMPRRSAVFFAENAA